MGDAEPPHHHDSSASPPWPVGTAPRSFPQRPSLSYLRAAVLKRRRALRREDRSLRRLETSLSASQSNLQAHLRSLLHTSTLPPSFEGLTASMSDALPPLTSALSSTLFLLDSRSTRLVARLLRIHPITLHPTPSICGLPLSPPYTDGPDDSTSSALGLCAHLVLMISKYLRLHLRHKVLSNSSRSAVIGDAGALLPLFRARGGGRGDMDGFRSAVELLDVDVTSLLAQTATPYRAEMSLLHKLDRLMKGGGSIVRRVVGEEERRVRAEREERIFK